MRYNHIVMGLVLLFVTSCAPIEPTRYENDLYINPEYQFSIRVPMTGWNMSEELPISFKKNMPYSTSQKFQATFLDGNKKSLILVAAEKTEGDWVSLKMYSDKFISEFEKLYALEKKKNIKKKGMKYYRYEIYKDQIENCRDACIASKFDCQAEDLKVTGHNIIYKSDYGMIYSATLILIAREELYSSSSEDFRNIVDSFRHL